MDSPGGKRAPGAGWISANWSQALLIISGALLAFMAFRLSDKRQGLATTSIVLAAGLIALGCLLSRMEGQFELGPAGLKGILKRFGQQARDNDLNDDELDEASELIQSQFAPALPPRNIEGRAHVRGSGTIRGTGLVDSASIVDRAVAQVIQTRGIPSEEAVGTPSVTQERPPRDPVSN